MGIRELELAAGTEPGQLSSTVGLSAEVFERGSPKTPGVAAGLQKRERTA